MGGLEVARHLAGLEQRAGGGVRHRARPARGRGVRAERARLPAQAGARERLAAALKKAAAARAPDARAARAARAATRANTSRSPSATASCWCRCATSSSCAPSRSTSRCAHSEREPPDRGAAGRARARVRRALRAHPPQLPGGARGDPRLRARRAEQTTSRTGWWCSTASRSGCRSAGASGRCCASWSTDRNRK